MKEKIVKTKLVGNKNAEKKIIPEQVIKLAAKFWNKTEIGAFFDCHADTITNRFQQEYTKGREMGKAKLRDLQLNAAKRGNTTMLVWLGKQYLGQTDTQTIEHTFDMETAKKKVVEMFYT